MSEHSRRDFLKTSGVFAGAAALNVVMPGGVQQQKASSGTCFQYAMCNESMMELSWEEQCRIVGQAGYTGIEIAPFTLVKAWNLKGVEEITRSRRKEMVGAMEKAGLTCAGLHWLLAPPPEGLHFTTPDPAVRKRTVAYLGALIDFCTDLGGTPLIFGSPKQRDTKGISIEEAKKHFADGLAAVADHARKRGVLVLIEPLDTSQTDVVNTLAESMEIVKKINHPAIKTMFDFHNTVDETEPLDVLIRKYYAAIGHVHVQEMDGKHLGTGNAVTAFVKAFQTLKDLKYDKWVSLEVFDFSPGGAKIAEDSMRVLKEIEAKLT